MDPRFKSVPAQAVSQRLLQAQAGGEICFTRFVVNFGQWRTNTVTVQAGNTARQIDRVLRSQAG